MRGKLTVVGKGQKADKPAAVTSAGQKKLDGFIAKLKPVAAKAGTDAKPGEVSAGIGIPNDRLFPAGGMTFAPKVVSIPVGGTVTWNLSFHTVSFNAPEDARPAFVKAANGSMLEIIPSEGARPSNNMKDPGIRHLAILVDDFDTAHAELKRQGVHFLGEPFNNHGNLLVFAMSLKHEDEAGGRKDHVHGDAGRDDGHALPDRLVLVAARVVVAAVGGLVAVHLADHLHVAAQRERGQLVRRLPPGPAAEGRPT